MKRTYEELLDQADELLQAAMGQRWTTDAAANLAKVATAHIFLAQERRSQQQIEEYEHQQRQDEQPEGAALKPATAVGEPDWTCTGDGKPTCTCPACTLSDHTEAYEMTHKHPPTYGKCDECGYYTVPGLPCPKCGAALQEEGEHP